MTSDSNWECHQLSRCTHSVHHAQFITSWNYSEPTHCPTLKIQHLATRNFFRRKTTMIQSIHVSFRNFFFQWNFNFICAYLWPAKFKLITEYITVAKSYLSFIETFILSNILCIRKLKDFFLFILTVWKLCQWKV